MLVSLLTLFLVIFGIGAALAMYFMQRTWGGAYLSKEAQ
jgi:hypothetical protein